MLMCLRRTSLLTSSVRWHNHSSNWRVALTTFIAPATITGIDTEVNTVEKAHGGEGKQGQTDIIVTGRWRGLVRPYLQRPTIAEWNKAACDRNNVGKRSRPSRSTPSCLPADLLGRGLNRTRRLGCKLRSRCSPRDRPTFGSGFELGFVLLGVDAIGRADL